MTRYEIQIQYPNDPARWHSFFESFMTMTEAAIRLIEVRDMFPKNEFKVVPIARIN